MSKRSDDLRRERLLRRQEKELVEELADLRSKRADVDADLRKLDDLLLNAWKSSGVSTSPEKATDFEWAIVFWIGYRKNDYGEKVRDFIEKKLAPYKLLFSESREEFFKEWEEAAFARLSLGHKVGAALALTSAPDDEIRAPWGAWSLQVPDHLIPIEGEREEDKTTPYETREAAKMAIKEALKIRAPDPVDTKQILLDMLDEIPPPSCDVQRVFCLGSEPFFALARTEAMKSFVILSHHGREKTPVWWELLRNLVKGACLVLDGAAPSKGGKWSSPNRGRNGPPEGAQYRLGKEVTIDLREELHRVLRGPRDGSSPAVQFLVRGHWRSQPHGEGRSLRRRQWIEPFWKGPEEARVLLRGHHVKG